MATGKIFAPPPEFSAQAHVKSEAIAEAFRETARAQPDSFWRELAKAIQFDEPFKQVLDWKMPVARWFSGGKINVSKNCLDRHLTANGAKTALIWEGEPLVSGQPETRKLTYRELFSLTCQIAQTLKSLGVAKGDRVAIYMPMVPETVATMLACARLGAVHTVIFGGFAAQSIRDRCQDSGAKLIVTADGTWRRGKFLELKKIVDDALASGDTPVKKVLVFEREKTAKVNITKGRDVLWSESVLKAAPEIAAEPLDTEDPLFILYTSGTTGKPKGLYHTQAGYLLGAHWSSRWLFDLQPNDIYWCTADCGWITGHTYVTYGPLSNGATVFMYEGGPTHPTPDRFWEMIDRHKISILYTAPTAIRMFMKLGDEYVKKHSLKTLRLLGSVGEPINPEAWLWYHETVGNNRCPIVDTWWQTETGGTMIAPFPGATPQKPGSATRPLPGIAADVINPETGKSVAPGEKGSLVIREPWPNMARGIWGDMARFEKTYWNTSPVLKGIYVTGDTAIRDADGDFWIEGRMDDVIKVAGHRIGSAEIESALVAHPDISEAAAVAIPDEVKGSSIVVFVTLSDASAASARAHPQRIAKIKTSARDFVGKEIGAHAKPDQVRIAKALPKTRSGKIMRRLLRELASSGKISGDTTTLEDFSAEASLSEEP